MKKILAVAAAVAVVTVAGVGIVHAGVQGSRHDMASASNTYTKLEGFATYGTCAPCHIPHGATGARLFPATVAATFGEFYAPLCLRCHDRTAGPGDINVDIDDTVAALNAHGFDATGLTATYGDTHDVAGSGLPYVTIDPATGVAYSGNEYIQCLSCHDVHNQKSFRPFLEVSLDSLCQDCHTNRENLGTGPTNTTAASGSTHPSGATNTGDVTGIAGGGTVADSPFIAGWGAELTTPTLGTTGSMWAVGAAWDSGMKLHDGTATGGVVCTSCHAVHFDEDDATPDNGVRYFPVVDPALVYAADGSGAAKTDANMFCEYCHQGRNVAEDGTTAAGSFWNPGDTLFSHPNDNVGSAATNVTVDMTWQPVTLSPISGTGASGIVCTSCHGVHGKSTTASVTEPGTPILLQYTTATVCDSCHTAANMTTVVFGDGSLHHPVGADTTVDTAGNTAGNVTCIGGNLAPGVGMCHGVGGGANGQVAHNRSSSFTAPSTSNSATCVACHTVNPSTYIPTNTYSANEEGSHFIGDASTAATTWKNGRTTGAGTAAIRYAGVDAAAATPEGTDTWAGSGLTSKFSSTTGLICESCHRLVEGNERSGDNTTTMLVEVAGSTIVTVAGAQDATDYTGAPYLCTGCHLVPSGTHPLLDADATKYATMTGAAGQSYVGAVSMNCDSCHSAHTADSDTGSYILDGGSTGTVATPTGMEVEPTIDYTDFCAVCHGTFK